VTLEDFTNITYTQASSDFPGVIPDPAPAVPPAWQQVSKNILQAAENFQKEIAQLHSSNQWQGATADAIWQNVSSSWPIPTTLSLAANVMHGLTQSFSSTITTTSNDISSKALGYSLAIMNYPDQQPEIDQEYNNYARAVMNNYALGIETISASNPSFNAGPPPQVAVAPGGPAVPTGPSGSKPTIPAGGATGIPAVGGVPTFGGGAGGVGAGAGPIPSVGAPNVPSTAQLTAQTTPGTTQSTTTSQTAPNSSATSGTPSATSVTPSNSAASPSTGSASGSSAASTLQGLGQAAYGPMQGLQSALGQAMNAGRGAGNPGALTGANGPGSLPKEGALALGKTPLGGGGGAGGGGAGVHSPLTAKLASAPATAAGTAVDRTVAAGYRGAGLSSAGGAAGAGAPGAGAPAAGQHGANAQPAPHQPSKMLRRKKNGEELIGDTEAVVPVLGAPAPNADAKPDAT
jgi:hypothetical protein